MATNYGGWFYCDTCGENIGYLCYSTYDMIDFKYTCSCGNEGKIFIDFIDSSEGENTLDHMIIIKNRMCCTSDSEPLITIIKDKLVKYDIAISCKKCKKIYKDKI